MWHIWALISAWVKGDYPAHWRLTSLFFFPSQRLLCNISLFSICVLSPSVFASPHLITPALPENLPPLPPLPGFLDSLIIFFFCFVLYIFFPCAILGPYYQFMFPVCSRNCLIKSPCVCACGVRFTHWLSERSSLPACQSLQDRATLPACNYLH